MTPAKQHEFRYGRAWFAGKTVTPEGALIGLRRGYSTAEMARAYWPESTEADIYNALTVGRAREASA